MKTELVFKLVLSFIVLIKNKIMAKELNIVISSREKIVSINSLYNVRINYVGGRPVPKMYKSPKAQRFADEARKQLIAVKIDEDTKQWLTETKKFHMSIEFILGSGINRRDVSNCDKLVIDQVTAWIRDDLGVADFDDSLLSDVYFKKSYIPKADKEYCCIRLIESTRNLNIVIEKPSKIWFNEFGDKFTFPPIPKRKKKNVNYAEKVEEKDQSDTKIYIINKDSVINNPFLISDIESDGYKCAVDGIGFVFVFYDKNDHLDSNMQKLQERVKDINYSNYRIIPIDFDNKDSEIMRYINNELI